MSVAGVKESRIKAVTAIVPAIFSTSPMMGFFKPEEELILAGQIRLLHGVSWNW